MMGRFRFNRRMMTSASIAWFHSNKETTTPVEPARAVRPEHLAELRIAVPDRDGVIAEIASLAAGAGINIYDIEIAHSAEGAQGVLILIVESADAETLRVAVDAAGYRGRAEQLS